MASGDFVFVIRPDDGDPYEVTADSRDVRLWERIGPRNTLRKLTDNPSMDDYYSLAHIAIKRRQLRNVPVLAEWVDTVSIMPREDAATSAGLTHPELVDAIDKALATGEATAELIADHVMDLLEDLRTRSLDPTRQGHSIERS